MSKVKGIKAVAKASQKINQRNKRTWLSIYFDIDNNKVITGAEYEQLDNQDGCFKLTELIRPCTEEEVEQTVNRFRWM